MVARCCWKKLGCKNNNLVASGCWKKLGCKMPQHNTEGNSRLPRTLTPESPGFGFDIGADTPGVAPPSTSSSRQSLHPNPGTGQCFPSWWPNFFPDTDAMGKWPAVIVDDFVSERVGGRLAGQRRLANLSRNFDDLGVVDHSKFIGRGLWPLAIRMVDHALAKYDVRVSYHLFHGCDTDSKSKDIHLMTPAYDLKPWHWHNDVTTLGDVQLQEEAQSLPPIKKSKGPDH